MLGRETKRGAGALRVDFKIRHGVSCVDTRAGQCRGNQEHAWHVAEAGRRSRGGGKRW